jgi:hypothetical protein
MQMPMSGFLAYETSNLRFEPGTICRVHERQGLLERINKILLTDNKTHRQRIKKSASERIATIPTPIEGLA